MNGIPRELAFAFAAETKWKNAFLAIEDASSILVVGMAERIVVTTYEQPSDLTRALGWPLERLPGRED